jgi:hypothetical protein
MVSVKLVVGAKQEKHEHVTYIFVTVPAEIGHKM